MQISDLVNQYNIAINAGQAVIKTNSNGEQVSSALNKLSEGTIFEGSINSSENGKVTIGLSNGQIISARLDTGVSITEGQSIFFEVKSNDGETIKLKPISLEQNTNPTLLKALAAAGLEVNNRTLDMVNSMMKEGMSIDAKSLLSMHMAVLNNPKASAETIVLMAKANIMPTAANTSMFEAYKSNSAVISDGIDRLSDSVSLVLNNPDVSVEQAIEFNKSVIDIITEQVPLADIVSEDVDESSIPKDIVLEDDLVVSQQVQEETARQEVPQENLNLLAKPVLNQPINDSANNNTANVILEDKQVETKPEAVVNNNDENIFVGSDVGKVLTKDQLTNFSNVLKELPDLYKSHSELFDENQNIKIDIKAQDLLKAIVAYTDTTKANNPEFIRKIFNDPAYPKLLEAAVKDIWSIEPNDITKPEALKELYDKILRQNEMILKSAEALPEKATVELKTSSGEIRDNVTFMNQVNDLYSFVQIPIKFSDQIKNGELYVYNNKRRNISESDELTAFLHFDLEHLGSTDISIRMKDKNVSCKWYLEDETALDIIENNLNLLDSRLKAKGYNCSFTCQAEENTVDFVDDFLRPAMNSANETGIKVSSVVHRYSFDMRA